MSLVWPKDEASSSVRQGATTLASVFSSKEALFSGQEEELAMWPLPEGRHLSIILCLIIELEVKKLLDFIGPGFY